jgi:hypothetical protein
MSTARNAGLANNAPPLRFHQVHGENIRLSNDRTVARRVESFCKGITFSNRPVKPNEKVRQSIPRPDILLEPNTQHSSI